jgi:Spy/CpxP family protein refolding chaperone
MRSKTSATVILIATFALGCVAGGVAHSLYHNRISSEESRPPTQAGPQGITGVLGNYLELDSAQKEELKDIVARSRERFRALSQQFAPQYDSIRVDMRQQIRNLLRPAQQGKFEEFLRDLDKRRKERESHP